jgi:Protein of unknown function (DUF3618)
MSATDRVNGSAPADSATPAESPAPPDAEALRAEIAVTRAQLGDTVEALAMKTDVKARTKDAWRHTLTEAAGRGRKAIGRGRESLARGRETVDRQQHALAGKMSDTADRFGESAGQMGRTAGRPADVWVGAGIGAAVAAAIGGVVWMRRRNSTSRPMRTATPWGSARVRIGR